VWAIADGDSPGQSFQVTEHWDGLSWSVVRVVQSPSGGAIVAVGRNDVGESQNDGALAHYDGVSWQTVGDDVRTFGASSDDDVWTQLDDDPPSVYVGGGTSWSPVPVPLGNGRIDAFAPFSPTDTWALVENANPTRTGVGLGPMHWDGSGWQVSDLTSVTPTLRNRVAEAITTVPGTDSVWVVGYSGGSPLRPMFLLASC
jgi:hypothetical protein